LPAAEPRKARRAAAPTLSAALPQRVAFEAHANGDVFACCADFSVGLGNFGPEALAQARRLREGLPLASFSSGKRGVDREVDLLVRRLSRRGLVEFCLSDGSIAIEPQTPNYWPQTPQLRDADTLQLSRFAYFHRRGDALALESPRADALFRLRDPRIAGVLAMLTAPRRIEELRREPNFPGLTLLALLADCGILLRARGRRPEEDFEGLALWEFHDLLFHARCTAGRHANPIGAVYAHSGVVQPLPAARPSWPGEKIALSSYCEEDAAKASAFAKLLRDRHSARSFDAARPIALAELARFLDGAARLLWASEEKSGFDDGGMAARPYPTAGAANELELYLAVENCEGLARGFYHYDSALHALAAIDAPADAFEALLSGAVEAMGAAHAPQILIVIAARFGRVSWKYGSIAYSLILKDAGVLTQTLYLMATEMGLGGCAIGISNIELFAKLTGVADHSEGPVAQFALGRPAG